MTTTTINTVAAKEEFSELLNRVQLHKERIILTRRDKEIAALIPIEDLLLLQASQNKNDLHNATEALKDARTHSTILPMTAPYHIKLAPPAHQYLQTLPQKHQKDILKLIDAIAINPRPPGAKKIEGMVGLYSKELDHLRLIYKIEDQEIFILLIK